MENNLKNVKYLHIMPDSRYTIDFTNRIEELYSSDEHFFIIHGCNDSSKYNLNNGVVAGRIGMQELYLIGKLSNSVKQVYLQSLYIDKWILILIAIIAIKNRKLFSWYIWSADLYVEHEREQSIKGLALSKRVKCWCRKKIIKNLDKIIVAVHGDYENAVRAYETSATEALAFYSYNLPDDAAVDSAKNSREQVLVGHSASQRLKHCETFKRLSDLGYSGEVISVLSYGGSPEYVEKVVQYGKRLFGKKFCPILNWFPYEEYIKMLSEIRAAIFPADRQNGIGNIMYLVYLGKKVFVAPENGILEHLKGEGVKIFELNDMDSGNILGPLTKEEIEKNQSIIRKLCSDEYFKERWDKVFEV